MVHLNTMSILLPPNIGCELFSMFTLLSILHEIALQNKWQYSLTNNVFD